MTLAEVLDALYGLDPADFVAARDAAARQARDDGDRELSAQIRALTKPSAAAWALNLLARNDQVPVLALLDLGDALREAQTRLSARDMRDLGRRRQEAVSGLARTAARLAAESGHRLSPAVATQVEQTLQAALADPDVGARLRLGRLTASAEYAGVGPGAGPGVVTGASARADERPATATRGAVPRPVRAPTAASPATKGTVERERARADLERVSASAAQAREKATAATAAVAELEAEQGRATADVARHEAALREARDRARDTGRRLREALVAQAVLQRRDAAAQEALRRARAVVDR